MTDSSDVLPTGLRDVVSADLRPVTPLASPGRRMLAVLPIAVLLLGAAVFVFNLRRDAPELGLTLTWVASTFQTLLGLVLTMAALREAVPGTMLSDRMIRVSFATAAAAVVLITWMTWLVSPTIVPERV